MNIIFDKTLVLLFALVLIEGTAITQDNQNKFKINSFDIDIGFYGVSEGFQRNRLIDEEFHFKSEYTPMFFGKAAQRRGSAQPVYNASINLSPFTKTNNTFSDNQTLRLSLGFIVSSQISLGGVQEKKSYPNDTLLVLTTSTQTGSMEMDTIYQDSSISNNVNSYINGRSIKIGGQYLFSTSKKLFKLSAGPGLDLNFMFNNTLTTRSSSYTSIDNNGEYYSSYTLPEFGVQNVETSKISAMLSVVPHFALYLIKQAKKRNHCFDKSSIYLSGMVGSQFMFSTKYDLKPNFVFGANFGIRYAL